jgi:hypothetical protein
MNSSVSKLPVRHLNSAPLGRQRISLTGQTALPYVVTVLLSVLLLIPVYNLRHVDLRIPLYYQGDAIFYEALFKNFVETGQYYVNSHFGAPGQGELYDFPVPYSTHLLGFSLLRLFTRDYGLAINLYYLATYPLIALIALYVFRRFGISTGLAVGGSVLFAFLPYHLLRAQYHLMHSSYFLIPLVAMAALWVSLGHPLFRYELEGQNRRPLLTRDGIISVVVCILIAGDNPYHAFFAGIFLVVAGLLGQFRSGHRRSIVTAAVLAAVVMASFAVNLIPNLVYFHTHGRTSIVARSPGDAEVYGLKIIQMLGPVKGHRIAALARWKDGYDRQAPLINENATATLGVIGSIGFMVLLGCFFVRRTRSLIYSLSVLNLGALLVGTLGGFGAIFSFTVWPQFRGYNRICVFIGFFSLFAVLLLLNQFLASLTTAKHRRIGLVIAPLVITAVGLADQIPTHFLPDRREVESRFLRDQAFINRVEFAVPPNSMIFNLPHLWFPQSPSPNQLGLYEEEIGYLHSKTLHWSHGAIQGRAEDLWISQVAAQPVPELVDTLAATGFAGIFVDRYGYADRGRTLEAQLTSAIGEEDPLVSQDGRYSFFGLASLAANLHNRLGEAELDVLRHPPFVHTGNGCWQLEIVGDQSWNWCDTRADLVISNPSHEFRKMSLRADFVTGWTDLSDLTIDGPGLSRVLRVSNAGIAWTEQIVVPPGDSVYTLHSDARPIFAPRDPRHLVFMLKNLQLHPVNR